MNKHEPPRSFGVFKPTGHTVFAFPALAQIDAAIAQLQATVTCPLPAYQLN